MLKNTNIILNYSCNEFRNVYDFEINKQISLYLLVVLIFFCLNTSTDKNDELLKRLNNIRDMKIYILCKHFL